MAVSDLESRAMDTQAPLTPPSDRMDLDSHGDTLPNGHSLRDSSLDKAVSLDSSFQVTSADNLKSYLHNNAITAEGTPDTSQETADLHLPASSKADLTATAFTSSVNHSARLKTDQLDGADNTVPDSAPSVVQAPTSDLRDEPQPATASQTAVIKEQKQEQDIAHDPELANGLISKAPESSETEVMRSEAVPEVPTALQDDSATLPKQGRSQTSTYAEEPVIVKSSDIPHHPPVPVPEGAIVEAPIDPAPSPAEDKPLPSMETSPHTPPSEDLQVAPNEGPPAPSGDQIMEERDAQAVTAQEAGDERPRAVDGAADIDQSMQDAPPSPSKVARPREEDEADNEPAVKRPRTDDEQISAPEFKKPDRPEISTDITGSNAASQTQSNLSQPVTVPQHKHLLRVLANLKRSKDAIAFSRPVNPLELNIPTYPSVVTKPMDLSTMEEKEKNNGYPSIDAFIADFNQIIENSELFNGSHHGVTQSAYRLRGSFLKQMEKLPGPEVAEPVRADKKKKVFATTDKPVAPRRESRSSLPGMARSPVTPATPTFALGPQGIPLIRRDSTMNAERPKREIHPPAPRDLPYANQKPRKKKYQMELKFCQHVLNEIKKPKYRLIADPFLIKVDPVALNIPTYHSIIKQPMDFGTIQINLNQGEYESAREFDLDAQLVFANCYKFNPAGHPVHEVGKQLQAVYNDLWKEKQAWIDKQAPPSGPTSADTTPEASEDEEEEEEEEEPEASNEILKLQQQIAAMSKQVELITQKKKSPPAAAKKTKGAPKPEKKGNKKAAPAPIPKSKSSSKSSTKRGDKNAPYVTYEQKQDISNRINSLPETKMAQALNIIRDNMPKLKGVEDDELELDIDELSNDVLYQLLQFVRKHAPKAEDTTRSAPAPPPAQPAASRKKNKPMSKVEQETRIQQVRGSLSAFDNPGSAAYAAGAGSSALQDEGDSSGDDDDSEESEEE